MARPELLLTYVSLYFIISANAEIVYMSETMISEKEIINKLKPIVQQLFETTGLIAVNYISLNVINLLPDKEIQADMVISVKIPKSKANYTIIFEVKTAGQPRYARMAVNQINSLINNRKNYYGVFAATFISEESKQICRENNIGFIDMAGNCFFKFDNIYISIEGRPNPYPNTRPLKTIFSDKSTRALRVLLCNPKKEWYVQELAKESNISIGQASNIKKRLLELEFIEEVKDEKRPKIKLLNPESLLIEWSKNYSYQKNKVKNFYSLDDVGILEKKLAEYFKKNNITYGFTLTSGASRIAPFLRYKRIFAFVKNEIESIAKDLNLKEVSTGANVSLLEPYDEGVFYNLQNINGDKIVSDVQLYLDLQNYKERGEEAARFLLDQKLRKQW